MDMGTRLYRVSRDAAGSGWEFRSARFIRKSGSWYTYQIGADRIKENGDKGWAESPKDAFNLAANFVLCMSDHAYSLDSTERKLFYSVGGIDGMYGLVLLYARHRMDPNSERLCVSDTEAALSFTHGELERHLAEWGGDGT